MRAQADGKANGNDDPINRGGTGGVAVQSPYAPRHARQYHDLRETGAVQEGIH